MTFIIFTIFICMGRNKLNIEDKKIKFTISIDKKIYQQLAKIAKNKSKYIEQMLFKSLKNDG